MLFSIEGKEDWKGVIVESIKFIVDVKLTDEKRNGSLMAYLTENRLSNANNTVIDAAKFINHWRHIATFTNRTCVHTSYLVAYVYAVILFHLKAYYADERHD